MKHSYLLHFLVILLCISQAETCLSCPGGSAQCGDNIGIELPGNKTDQCTDDDWEKYEGNPVFQKGERGEWDAEGVTCFVVRHFPWSYMMYYCAGGEFQRGFGLAQSRDGINWVRDRDNPVMVPDSGVTVWGPEVLHDGEKYHMWYVSRGPDMDGISYCTSEDGREWIQSENNPVIDHGGCNAVIWDGEQWRMFLQHQTRVERETRSAFELLTSADGENWESRGFPFISGEAGTWDEITAAPSVAYYENRLHLWYTGADTVGNRRGEIAIGHVVSEDWGESFQINIRQRETHRELRPTEEWEGRGIYSSGVEFDGEYIYIWYAAAGFGYAKRPVENYVRPEIETKPGLNLWSVSPNPSDGPVMVNYLGTLDTNVDIRIFDMAGREVIQRQFSPNQPIRLDPKLLGLPEGQYMIGINAKGREIHKRLVYIR